MAYDDFDDDELLDEPLGIGELERAPVVFPDSLGDSIDKYYQLRAQRLNLEKEVKERLKEAHSTADRLLKDYCSKWIGIKLDILVEDKQENYIKGLTRNYIKSAALRQDGQIGEEIQVTAERYENGVLFSGSGTNIFSDNDGFPDFL